MLDPMTNAITNYHDLNAAVVDELHEEPSPLEFSRCVAKNRPFVVRQAAARWDAVRNWNADYLDRVMADQSVNVAITPLGNADAVVEREDGTLVFVQPYETTEPFTDFFADVRGDSKSSREGASRPVKYAQTQNDNLRDEYSRLSGDVPRDIPFARIALAKEADAINVWIGNDRSVTALHKDNYENIYVQVRGQKHFVLLPPVELPCVNEQAILQARYEPADEATAGDDGTELLIRESSSAEALPVPIWDPDDASSTRATRFSHLAKPLRVTLDEGDMLYLPAMWYHKVRQTAGEEGFACAVNYWYDMDFGGGFWTANEFMRDVVGAEERKVRYPGLELDGDD